MMVTDMGPSTSYHIFCRGLNGRTVSVPVKGGMDVTTLKLVVQSALNVSACEQLLVHAGRCLTDSTTLAAAGVSRDSTVHLHLRLCGGKGGFGALLRGQGRDGKVTDNFDACRDLSGRRIRHVEAEKQLKEWQKDAKERELEKLALQHMKKVAKDAKRQKMNEETIEEVKEQQRKAAAAVQESINAALAAADSGDSSQSAGDAAAGDSPTAAAAAGSKRPATELSGGSGSSSPPKRQRANMLDILDAVSDDDSDSDDDAE